MDGKMLSTGASGTVHEPPLLEVERLTTRFATAEGSLLAVDEVSFALNRGETLGLVGESGSGKSILVRTLMNIAGSSASVTPETRIRFEGRDLSTVPKQELRHFWGRQMAMIFQDPMTSLNPVRRVGRQIIDPMRFHLGLSKAEALDRAIELLRTVGIPHPERRVHQYPHEMSGGMRQRIMIAIALSCEPKLLIADEPTTALDVTVQRQILDLLGQLQADLGMAMILITHDLGVVAGRADRIAVMYAGQVVESSDTRGLFESTSHPYSKALLEAIPRLRNKPHSRLAAIPGAPPNMLNPGQGCRFAARCSRVEEQCLEEMPLLDPHGAGHRVRCWFPIKPAGGASAETAAHADELTIIDGSV